MNKSILLIAFLLTFFSASMTAQKSPRKAADGEVNGVKVAIDYSAPSVKERTIWGGLEDYDVVWRAGADKNTTISIDQDVSIGGQKLAAGKYGFFIIPKEEGDWTVIFNKKNDGWGAYSYKQSEDALRLDVTPKWVEENQEQLSYSLSENAIVFAWEKVKLVIPLGER